MLVQPEGVQVFAETERVSSRLVHTLFQDREGTIWAGTTEGLERFTRLTVGTLDVNQRLPGTYGWAVLGARDGSVWIATTDGLRRWRDGHLTIPSTGSPMVNGKLNGISVRAPVPTGSVVDLVAEVSRSTTVEEINEAFAAKSDTGALEGILRYSEDPLVSTDIVRSPYSSIFDAPLTMVIDEKLVKVLAWYDNEWGYSNRVVDLAQRVLAGAPVA